MSSDLLLSFYKDRFILTGKDAKICIQKDPKSWTERASPKSKSYETTNIRAALGFWHYTDSIAQKILKRIKIQYYPTPDELPSFLDSHQEEGVNWILSRSRSYLAHAPGAGKTAQAIVAAHLSIGPGQILFIVPPSLTTHWARETERFLALMDDAYWPSISVVPESKSKDSMGWKAEWIICPDSMLAKPWVLANLIKMPKLFVAVDEASRFKEPTALRTIALFGGRKGDLKSPGLIQKARHAVLLDGSPMPNRPMELWAPTYAMAPETIDFMGEHEFGLRYCGAQINDWGHWEYRGSSHEEELKNRLQNAFMHVVPESRLRHPERRRTMLYMSEDPRSREYVAWERKLLGQTPIHELLKSESQGELALRRRELGVSKIDWIARYVSERLEVKGESILLFAWHREVCQGLYRALKEFRPALVMGGTQAKERDLWFEQFQNGNCRLIIGNIAAMGRGHNLQKADRVIFGEFSWTDELNLQCEKRASRRGRDESKFVRCEYIVAPGSLDEVVLKSVFNKARNVQRVIGS